MADELDGIIQRMIDAGEPEENIATVIHDYEANPSATKPDESSSLGPGIMTGLAGAGIMAKGPALLKSAVSGVGKAVEAAKVIPKWAGGALGGTLGADLTGMVGHPFAGAYAGGALGAKMGKRLAKPIEGMGKFIQSLSESGATSSPAVQMGRRILGTGGSKLGTRGLAKLVPLVGAGLMAKDAYDGGHWVGEKIDHATGASDKLGRLLAPLFGSSGENYDEMVKALMAQEGR